ncbi:MAG: Holliday junction branch migration protein RuvA [Clostridiales bacterium]|nr:Holliday junction branch migration protein RuvA [Clostridiales bacterium]
MQGAIGKPLASGGERWCQCKVIAFIEGKVAEKNHGELVINAGGVGFSLLCSNATIAAAPDGDRIWRCYTVMNVREDAMELFGFATKLEREMFRKLCTVTGVGAKTALGILSALPLRDLSIAIVTGDVNALSRAPGIGKKTAQRIILELKDKVEQAEVSSAAPGVPAPVAAPVGNSAQREAQAALQALGYTSAEAARALNLVRDQADTADKLILLAVRQLSAM